MKEHDDKPDPKPRPRTETTSTTTPTPEFLRSIDAFRKDLVDGGFEISPDGQVKPIVPTEPTTLKFSRPETPIPKSKSLMSMIPWDRIALVFVCLAFLVYVILTADQPTHEWAGERLPESYVVGGPPAGAITETTPIQYAITTTNKTTGEKRVWPFLINFRYKITMHESQPGVPQPTIMPLGADIKPAGASRPSAQPTKSGK